MLLLHQRLGHHTHLRCPPTRIPWDRNRKETRHIPTHGISNHDHSLLAGVSKASGVSQFTGVQKTHPATVDVSKDRLGP